MDPMRGGCQCGAVRYEVSEEPLTLGMCFCRDCQQQSGSAFGMSLVVPKRGFRLVQGETASFTRPAESGNTTDCHFCPRCGTRLYHLPGSLPGNVNVKPGSLDDASGLEPRLAVWTIRKPAWLTLPAGIAQFERNPKPRTD
jgi:hypothetical protein